jgi:hypothetical protein
MKTLAAAVWAVLLSLPANAAGDMQNPARLRGELFIAGATLVDPPPDERRDTHAYMTVSGEGAARLYAAMAGAATPDLCIPGRRLKRAGPLTCSVGARASDARCDFAINLGDGSLAPGLVC